MKRKLIVVYEDSKESCAQFIGQLISDMDDGTEATVWNEKTYKAEQPKLSTSNRLLFVGDGIQCRKARERIRPRFDRCGIQYGWLGTTAFILVDHAVAEGEIGEFRRLCLQADQEPKEEIGRLLTFAPSGWETPSKEPSGLVKVVKDGAVALRTFAGQGAMRLGTAVKKREIIDFQYSVAAVLFCRNGLNAFQGE